MNNFTFVPSHVNVRLHKPRHNLIAQWDRNLGLVAATATKRHQLLHPSSQFKMDVAELIRISAQRGGFYAR